MNTEYPENGQQTRSREQLREMIWPDKKEANARRAFDPRMVREFGSSAGLLLSQLVFWTGKGDDPEWIYKTKSEIENEVGISPDQTDYARKSLEKQGVLKAEKRPRRDKSGRVKGPSPVWHYWVDLIVLAERLGIEVPSTLNLDSKPGKVPGSSNPDPNPEEFQVQTRESSGFESGKVPGSSPEESPVPNQRDPQRNLSENSFRDSAFQAGEPASSSRSAPNKNRGEDQESRSSGADPSPNIDTIPGDLAPQEESVREPVEVDSPPDHETVPLVDSARVIEARRSLRALIDEWPGHAEDIAIGKWNELAMTMAHLGFASERYGPGELELAARTLEEQQPERIAV